MQCNKIHIVFGTINYCMSWCLYIYIQNWCITNIELKYLKYSENDADSEIKFRVNLLVRVNLILYWISNEIKHFVKEFFLVTWLTGSTFKQYEIFIASFAWQYDLYIYIFNIFLTIGIQTSLHQKYNSVENILVTLLFKEIILKVIKIF